MKSFLTKYTNLKICLFRLLLLIKNTANGAALSGPEADVQDVPSTSFGVDEEFNHTLANPFLQTHLDRLGVIHSSVDYLGVHETCSSVKCYLDDNDMIILREKQNMQRYKCRQYFEAKNSDSQLELHCQILNLHRSCIKESLTIYVDGAKKAIICGKKWYPEVWRGKQIFLHYIRRFSRLSEGYICSMVALNINDLIAYDGESTYLYSAAPTADGLSFISTESANSSAFTTSNFSTSEELSFTTEEISTPVTPATTFPFNFTDESVTFSEILPTISDLSSSATQVSSIYSTLDDISSTFEISSTTLIPASTTDEDYFNATQKSSDETPIMNDTDSEPTTTSFIAPNTTEVIFSMNETLLTFINGDSNASSTTTKINKTSETSEESSFAPSEMPFAETFATNSSITGMFPVLSDPCNSCGISVFFQRKTTSGQNITRKSHPWMVFVLVETESFTGSCGGTLISSRTVLTTAHCLDFNIRLIFLGFGMNDLLGPDEKGFWIPANSFKIFEDYNSQTMQGDIAVITLAKNVQFNDFVRPICMPEADIGSLEGKPITITGWGLSSEQDLSLSRILQEVNLTIWTNSRCNSIWSPEGFSISDQQICASEKGKDSCFGDSGGPSMILVDDRWVLAGIVSFGFRCGDPNFPGVYTRITEFIDWINENSLNTTCPIYLPENPLNATLNETFEGKV